MKKTKQQEWEDKFFQICLALLSRPTSRTQGFLSSPNLKEIVETSEDMIMLLQKREAAKHEIRWEKGV